MLGESAVFLLENLRVVTGDRIAISIVLPVFIDRIDEEEAEHFDALGNQALFLIQMLFDRAMDHLALHGQGIDLAVGLTRAQVHFAAGESQFHELIGFTVGILGVADVLSDDDVPIQFAPGDLFELVEWRNRHDLATDSMLGGLVDFNLGPNHAFPTNDGGDELHIGLVVPTFH